MSHSAEKALRKDINKHKNELKKEEKATSPNQQRIKSLKSKIEVKRKVLADLVKTSQTPAASAAPSQTTAQPSAPAPSQATAAASHTPPAQSTVDPDTTRCDEIAKANKDKLAKDAQKFLSVGEAAKAWEGTSFYDPDKKKQNTYNNLEPLAKATVDIIEEADYVDSATREFAHNFIDEPKKIEDYITNTCSANTTEDQYNKEINRLKNLVKGWKEVEIKTFDTATVLARILLFKRLLYIAACLGTAKRLIGADPQLMAKTLEELSKAAAEAVQ